MKKFLLCSLSVCLLAVNAKADDSEWTDVGNAKLMDGWLQPAFGIDQTDPANQYDVLLQRNNDQYGLFRLVDPYKTGPVAAYNESEEPGYIMFDISDPDHVVFKVANAGFVNQKADITEFYCMNNTGYLLNRYGWTLEELVEMADDDFLFTTFKNNVVTLTHIYDEFEGMFYDACFGKQNEAPGVNNWSDKGVLLNMDSSITFPENWNAGVGEITVAPETVTRYFNLNGVEIKEPTKGSIVIKVENGKAVKQLIK